MGLPLQSARKQLCVSNEDTLRRNMGKIIASALVHKELLDQNVGKHDMAAKARATYADAPVSAINPAHYRQGSGVECIDVVRHLPFAQGNAMKYVWRAGYKDDIKQDLEKALWYVNDCIAQNAGVVLHGDPKVLLDKHLAYLLDQEDDDRERVLYLLSRGLLKTAAVAIKTWLNSL